jgi:3-dehydroquinate synthase
MDNPSLTISLPDGRTYPIFIGSGLEAKLTEITKDKRAIFITDEEVAPHWLGHFAKNSESVTVGSGESTKSFSNLESLLDQLLELNPDRKTLLIALGGGVVGDLTGFAASIILRGVPFIQIPTTLLSQVDSSVGGKTGINTQYGKNLIGSFYQPQAVLIDTNTLNTLPDREVRSGFSEIIKAACIADAEFFAWLEEHHQQILQREPAFLQEAIQRSVAIKAKIVEQDEREAGKRALLNLGHTFGHALEKEFAYDGSLTHGEAVAIGTIMAYDYAAREGLCNRADAERVRKLIELSGLVTKPPHWPDAQTMVKAMRQDKKAENGKLTFILPHGIGKAEVHKSASTDSILNYLQELSA